MNCQPLCRGLILVMLLAALAPRAAHAQFYYPDALLYDTPAQHGLKYESVIFASQDGTKLNGWFVPATTHKVLGTVVHLHGNAQNISAHFGYVAWLPPLGYNVFTFDYRGFGKSAGKPDREGVFADCVAALAYVQTRKEVDASKLLLFGQSLGGANAIALAATAPAAGLRGVAAESSFYSYTSIAKDKAPAGLVDLLITDEHSPGPVVGQVAPVPLLIIHGTADGVVPYAHAENLFNEAKLPKTLWTVKGGGHLGAFNPPFVDTYRPKLAAFFRACLEQKAVTKAHGK